jgi:hypothetical protein
VVEPMLQMCSLSAINLPTVDMAVYMINCIYTMHSMLSLYEYTDVKLEKLQAQVGFFIFIIFVEKGRYRNKHANLAP